jgi:hypothetical protein
MRVAESRDRRKESQGAVRQMFPKRYTECGIETPQRLVSAEFIRQFEKLRNGTGGEGESQCRGNATELMVNHPASWTPGFFQQETEP